MIYSIDQHRQLLADVAAAGNLDEAARRFGVTKRVLSDRTYRARRALALAGEIARPPIPDYAVPPDGFVVRRHSSQIDGDGNLERQWIETGIGSTDGYEVPEGHTVKGESTLLDSHGNVIVQWVKTEKEKQKQTDLIDGLKQAFAEYEGKAPAIIRPASQRDDVLTLYMLPDLHLGMHAWGRETGDNYDTKIAVDMAMSSVADLVEQSHGSQHAVILGLGDYFHANDDKNMTPRSGNILDVDGRWPKVFAAGAKLATNIVDMVARRHEEVEGVFLPGNHDPTAAVALTVALALFYSKTDHISIHQEPGVAWYRRFGKVLLGATHGHTMKPERMAMMLASDRPEDWGQTLYRYFYFGHIHHETALEVGPVRCESFQSPAAKDGFAAGGGFRSGRSMTAIRIHRERGEIGRHRVNIFDQR